MRCLEWLRTWRSSPNPPPEEYAQAAAAEAVKMDRADRLATRSAQTAARLATERDMNNFAGRIEAAYRGAQ